MARMFDIARVEVYNTMTGRTLKEYSTEEAARNAVATLNARTPDTYGYVVIGKSA